MRATTKRQRQQRNRAAAAEIDWGRRLARRVEAIMRKHPGADPDTIRLTLIALQLSLEERLRRSLRRGQGFAAFRS